MGTQRDVFTALWVHDDSTILDSGIFYVRATTPFTLRLTARLQEPRRPDANAMPGSCENPGQGTHIVRVPVTI